MLEHVKHGSPSGYNAGCKCAPCTAANTERKRRQRQAGGG